VDRLKNLLGYAINVVDRQFGYKKRGNVPGLTSVREATKTFLTPVATAAA
jgi:hypothetical protein